MTAQSGAGVVAQMQKFSQQDRVARDQQERWQIQFQVADQVLRRRKDEQDNAGQLGQQRQE